MGEGKFGVCSSAVFTWDSHLMNWEVTQNNTELFIGELSVKNQTKKRKKCVLQYVNCDLNFIQLSILCNWQTGWLKPWSYSNLAAINHLILCLKHLSWACNRCLLQAYIAEIFYCTSFTELRIWNQMKSRMAMEMIGKEVTVWIIRTACLRLNKA